MLRSALVLSAGLLASLIFNASAAAQSTAPLDHNRPRATVCDDGNAFASGVFTLSYNYDPSVHIKSAYAPPVGVVAVPEPFRTDLAAAYCAASPQFRRQLTALAGIFITCATPLSCTPSNENGFSNSWGFHENTTDQSEAGRTYVALSAGLWGSGNQLPIYSLFEYNLIENLLGRPGLSVSVKVDTNSDTTSMTVLAALAHELGHIYWWTSGIQIENCQGSGLFSNISWINTINTPQFHKFGQQQHSAFFSGGDVPKGYLDKDAVLLALAYGRRYAHDDLAEIYSGDWASLFATVSPDEDFVETYKLATLNSLGLRSLQVQIAGHPTVDMITFLQNDGYGSYSGLFTKANWIRTCLR